MPPTGLVPKSITAKIAFHAKCAATTDAVYVLNKKPEKAKTAVVRNEKSV